MSARSGTESSYAPSTFRGPPPPHAPSPRVGGRELGDVAAAAEDRLGEAVPRGPAHLPVEVVLDLREAREVGVDELLGLVRRDLQGGRGAGGVHPVRAPGVRGL